MCSGFGVLAGLDLNGPSVGLGGSITGEDIASDRDEATGRTLKSEFADGRLGGVSLGDASEIQSHSLVKQACLMIGRFDVPPIHQLASGGEVGIGDESIRGLPLAPPEVRERAHGGIESSGRLAGQQR